MLIQQLEAARKTLNEHVLRIHAPLAPSGWTPFQILAQLVRIREAAIKSENFALPDCEQRTVSEMGSRRDLLADVVKNAESIGTPAKSPWHGVGASAILPSDTDACAVDGCSSSSGSTT